MYLICICAYESICEGKERTSLMEDTASTTSFVNVLPTPDDPIRTVGLIAWNSEKYVSDKRQGTIVRLRDVIETHKENSSHLDST